MSDTPTEVDAGELTGVLATPHWERRAWGKAVRREVPRSTHERDHAALVRAIQDGRITAEAGV